MTAPRQILRNATLLVSRRCSERRMFMRPSPRVKELLLYILAVTAERFGIQLHAYCFMSNHFHLVLTDPRAKLPRFEQQLAAFIARSLNALHRRREAFWAPGSYSAVTLVEAADVLDKIAYTLANPVAAGLVRHASDWPGAWSSPDAIGGPPLVARRPEHFFRAEGPFPATATLRLIAPQGCDSVEEVRRVVRADLERREAEAAQRHASRGKPFLGVRGVLRQDPFARASGDEPKRTVNPRIACRDPKKRSEALARLKSFVRAYRDAWGEFASGVRDAVFPHGTYWMRVAYGVPCAQAG